MADANVIEEFLVRLGFSIDTSGQGRFKQSLVQSKTAVVELNKELGALQGGLSNAATEFAALGGVPTEKFVEGSRKVGEVILSLNKGFGVLTASVAGAGVAFVTAMIAVGTQYEQLYYTAKRVGDTATDLEAAAFAAKQVGDESNSLTATLQSMTLAMRKNPGVQAMVDSWRGGIHT